MRKYNYGSIDMIRFILLVLTLVSCIGCSGYLDEKSIGTERILPDSVSFEVPDFLDVLMSRELTEKTTFVVDECVLDVMSQSNGRDSDFHRHLLSGMLYKQKGNYSEAMKSIIQAEEYMTKDVAARDKGLLYMGRVVLYRYMNAHYKSARAALRASQYFDMAQDDNAFFDSLIEVARSYSMLGYHAGALSMLSIVRQNLSSLDIETRTKYHDSMLTGYMALDRTQVPEVLKEMKDDLGEKHVYWLNVAHVNDILGQKDSAVMALERYRRQNPDYEENPAYHGVAVGIFNEQGLYKEASESHMKYSKGVEDMLVELVSSDILNLEQVKEAGTKGMRYKQLSMILFLCIVITLLIAYIVWFAMKRNLSRKQDEIDRQSELLKAVEQESDRLKTMYENKTLDKGLRDVLMERIAIFNQFTLSRMSPNYSEKLAEDELLKLIDSKDTFLESTCKTFEILHPEFAAYLAESNLTEKERGCCCLYCMGMRGTEIAAYMGLTDQSYYNFSGVIRKKLGLMEYKTKLDLFLRDKLAQLDKS